MRISFYAARPAALPVRFGQHTPRQTTPNLEQQPNLPPEHSQTNAQNSHQTTKSYKWPLFAAFSFLTLWGAAGWGSFIGTSLKGSNSVGNLGDNGSPHMPTTSSTTTADGFPHTTTTSTLSAITKDSADPTVNFPWPTINSTPTETPGNEISGPDSGAPGGEMGAGGMGQAPNGTAATNSTGTTGQNTGQDDMTDEQSGSGMDQNGVGPASNKGQASKIQQDPALKVSGQAQPSTDSSMDSAKNGAQKPGVQRKREQPKRLPVD